MADEQPSVAYDGTLKPQMRYVEAHPVGEESERMFVLQDPTGLSEQPISMNEVGLFVLSQFDGEHTLDEVRERFQQEVGRPLPAEQVALLVEALEEAHLLAGPSFDAYYAEMVKAYRAAPTREMRSAADLRLVENTGKTLQALVNAEPAESPAGLLVGLVAPHLDYPRGEPCYSAAYSVAAKRKAPQRIVFLGTNHFGRTSSAVATGKDFETPLGVTAADVAFIEKLEQRGGGSLREGEFDHQREHSIELNLLLCQHIWGAGAFQMVAVLCPDPCGPTGTKPWDGCGIDLADFATALRETVADDEADTLIVAGADLSHVGQYFGGERPLDDAYLAEVAERDKGVLSRLEAGDAAAFLARGGAEGNPTHICSVGCIWTAMSALPGTRPHLLRYHQAVDRSIDNAVTCAAAAFMRDEA